jgi:hypothetical protein
MIQYWFTLTSTVKVVQRIQQNSWFWTNCLIIKQGVLSSKK